MLVSLTDTDLATGAQTSGHDILFTAADGTTKLNHEIETYTSSSGTLAAWVQVPSLSTTTDTVIYVYYANASATDQQNQTAVWDSNYKTVWHMANGTTLSGADSTSNGSTLTTITGSVTAASGKVGDGASIPSSGNYAGTVAGFSSAQAAVTISGWVNVDASYDDSSWGLPFWGDGMLYLQLTSSRQAYFLVNAGGSSLAQTSLTVLTKGTWYYIVGVYDGTNTNIYVNGSPDNDASSLQGTGTVGVFSSAQLGGNSFVGLDDEFRISNTARSADWIATEYNNQGSPSSFISEGSQEAQGGGGSQVATPAFTPPSGTYTSGQTVTISTDTSGASIRYTTDGSTPSETAGTVYTAAVSVSSNETLKAIAYKTGLTDSTVASAAYTVQVSNPIFSPGAGTYTSSQTVTINTVTSGATIRYTTDGSTPSETVGTIYSGTITVSATTTIKAIAYASGLGDSGLVAAGYNIATTTPSITSVTPTSGASGTQVTISGSGFGSAQGTGTVWLGSTLGVVGSWSSTQIVAAVASNATSGSIQVQQNGASSNAVSFSVSGATISSITPTSGVSGTSVTITGSGFGASQGSGQVWLGSMNGVVQSWSDTQVVAQVASGSASGQAQVLQNGVLSNAISFTVNTPHITSISPSSGSPGTSVTITGSGFGIIQGTGAVTLGSIAGAVVSWSDTQVVASVATSALTGIARIQQNAISSNTLSFAVPVISGTAVTLVPNLNNMVVGDTRPIQALNSTWQPVTGLTWTSSDTSVVSLSTDDPPVMTALAAGHVTITAGTASADVTVSSGALPLGTALWSVPGDFDSIIPAVPSPTGVADVFGIQNSGTIQAITSDGTVAWTWTGDVVSKKPIADFQGGLLLVDYGNKTVIKVDGLTGQTTATYTSSKDSLGAAAVHPDGTVFVIEQDSNNTYVTGIDSATGSQKFSVQAGTWESFATSPIVAGDGYAYVVYATAPNDRSHVVTNLLRVDSSGAYDVLHVFDSTYSGPVDLLTPGITSVITNGDTGAFFTGEIINGTQVTPVAVTTSGTGVSVVNSSYPDVPPGWDPAPWIPVLQREDGSFVGTIYDLRMVAYDAGGNLLWSVPNEQPQIATADGGVIGKSGITYDQNGNATGQINMAALSWLGNTYQVGSVDQILMNPTYVALSFWAFQGGNQSGNGSAAQNPEFPELKSCTDKGSSCGAGPQPRDLIWNAMQDLIRRLANSSCRNVAKSQVFDKVTFGGIGGFGGSAIDPGKFVAYLANTYHFYDGSTSALNRQNAVRGEGNINQDAGPSITLKDYFAGSTQPTAVTVTASHPLKTFLQPVYTGPDDTGFGVGIDPNNSGANIYNESVLFHEALHGFTGLFDGDLGTSYELNIAGVLESSEKISIYIKNNVLSASACTF